MPLIGPGIHMSGDQHMLKFRFGEWGWKGPSEIMYLKSRSARFLSLQ